MSRITVDVGDELDIEKRPNGNDSQGFTLNEIDRQCGEIARRLTGQSARDLTILCGIDGCQHTFTGSPNTVFAERNDHRSKQHPAFKPKKHVNRITKVPERSLTEKRADARDNARKRFELRPKPVTTSTVKKPRGRQPHTRGVLLFELRAFHQRTGRVPGERELTAKNGMPACSCYVREFGSLSNAIREAGMEPIRPGQYDRATARPRINALSGGQVRRRGKAA